MQIASIGFSQNEKVDSLNIQKEENQKKAIYKKEIISGLKSKNNDDILKSLDRANYIQDAEILDEIEKLISNDNPTELKVECIGIIKRAKSTKSVLLFKEILNNKTEDEKVLFEIALSLPYMGDSKESLNYLKKVWAKKDWLDKTKITRVYRYINSSETIQLLKEILKEEPGIATNAAMHLAKLGYIEVSYPIIKRHLNHENNHTRAAALNGLKYIGDEEAIVLIRKMLDDPEYTIRYHAYGFLKQNGYKDIYLKKKSKNVNYDREAAADYSNEWWNDLNPDYDITYDADCANFVSQCLIAGGLDLTAGTDGEGTGVDNYNAIPFCDNLHTHLVTYQDVIYTIKGDPREPSWMDKGDVAIFGSLNGDNWQHAVFSVWQNPTGNLYNAHNNNRQHRYVTWFYSESQPNAFFYHIQGEGDQTYLKTLYGIHFDNYKKTKSSEATYSFVDLSIGNPTGWLWDFGDGNTSTEQNPTHTYLNSGCYTVALTITKNGQTSSLVKEEFVCVSSDDNDMVDADYTFKNPIYIYETIQFHDATVISSTNWISDWDWSFYNDGYVDKSYMENPMYVFNNIGSYDVKLKVTDRFGNIDYKYGLVNVIERGDPFCGNGTVEPGENQYNCPQDCGSINNEPFCGNGICERGENILNCSDCNGCSESGDLYYSNTSDLPYLIWINDNIVLGREAATPNGDVVINSGDKVHIRTQGTVTFNEGFKVEPDGYLQVWNEPCDCDPIEVYYGRTEVTNRQLYKISPNNDGINDELCFYVIGAHEYDIDIRDKYDYIYEKNNVEIVGNIACVWDGDEAKRTINIFEITFRSNCSGEAKTFKGLQVNVYKESWKKTALGDDIISYNDKIFEISPNPNNGIFNIGVNNVSDYDIDIFNTLGKKVYSKSRISENNFQVDISEFSKGVYYIQLVDKENSYSQKIICK